jgi:hypothetical protein
MINQDVFVLFMMSWFSKACRYWREGEAREADGDEEVELSSLLAGT